MNNSLPLFILSLTSCTDEYTSSIINKQRITHSPFILSLRSCITHSPCSFSRWDCVLLTAPVHYLAEIVYYSQPPFILSFKSCITHSPCSFSRWDYVLLTAPVHSLAEIVQCRGHHDYPAVPGLLAGFLQVFQQKMGQEKWTCEIRKIIMVNLIKWPEQRRNSSKIILHPHLLKTKVKIAELAIWDTRGV